MKSNWNYPTTMWVGENRVKDLGIACKNLNISRPLLVTDNGLAKSSIVIDVLKNLKYPNPNEIIKYNPTVDHPKLLTTSARSSN